MTALEEAIFEAALAISKQLPVTGPQQIFGVGVRNAVRGLWRSEISGGQFTEQMRQAVIDGHTQAFYEGADICGIRPDELSAEETDTLADIIDEQLTYIEDFNFAIREGSREEGGLLGSQISRADLWEHKYHETRAIAQTIACADQKLEWVIDPTKDNCVDCLRYNGHVHRASVWQSWGIRPQMTRLACGGWRCGCSLDPTDARGTPGRPPLPTFS